MSASVCIHIYLHYREVHRSQVLNIHQLMLISHTLPVNSTLQSQLGGPIVLSTQTPFPLQFLDEQSICSHKSPVYPLCALVVIIAKNIGKEMFIIALSIATAVHTKCKAVVYIYICIYVITVWPSKTSHTRCALWSFK